MLMMLEHMLLNGDLFLWMAGLGLLSLIAWPSYRRWPNGGVFKRSMLLGLAYATLPLAFWISGLIAFKPACAPEGPCRTDGMQLMWMVALPILAIIGFIYASKAAFLTTFFLHKFSWADHLK